MKSFAFALCLLVGLGAAACGSGGDPDSVVYVRVTSSTSLPAVTRLSVAFANAGDPGLELFPSATSATPISFDPAATFVLVLPRKRTGRIDIVVGALDAASNVVAQGAGFGTINVGGRTDIAIRLDPVTLVSTPDAGVDAPVADVGVARDAATADLNPRADTALTTGSGGAGGSTSPPGTGGITDGGRTTGGGGAPGTGGRSASGGIWGTGGIRGTGGIASTGGIVGSLGGTLGSGGVSTTGGAPGTGGGTTASVTCTTDLMTLRTGTDENWIPSGPLTCGVQGAIYAYGDGTTCTSPSPITDTPCAPGSTGCCISGATVVDPTAVTAWGCALGIDLSASASSGAKTAYAGPAKGFKITISGTMAAGQRIRIGYASTATVSGGQVAPFVEVTDVGTYSVLFSDVTCPSWTGISCTPVSGSAAYSMSVLTVGGTSASDVVGAFKDLCITSLTPIL